VPDQRRDAIQAAIDILASHTTIAALQRHALAAALVDAVHAAGRDGQDETESRLALLAEQLLAALELEDDGKTTLAQYVAMLVEQRDQLRYERHLLGVARMTLDLVAAGDPTRWDHARAQAEDVAQRIHDEIGHPVTDEPALGPELRAENARLTAELAGLRQRIADPRACPACATQPHHEPAERHVHVTPHGYAIWAPDHDLPLVDTLRAEGYRQAVVALRGVVQRTGSPAAKWAADYLEAVGPGTARAAVDASDGPGVDDTTNPPRSGASGAGKPLTRPTHDGAETVPDGGDGAGVGERSDEGGTGGSGTQDGHG
jgi:hypothetical protein